MGNRLSVTDADGDTTSYAYDARNDLVTVTDALNGVARYAYDADHRLTSVSDPDGNQTTYAYDADGGRTQVTRPPWDAAPSRAMTWPAISARRPTPWARRRVTATTPLVA